MKPQALPLGTPIPPNDLHGVSVSIPTVRDAIKHEQGDPETLAALKQGYPRNRASKTLETLRQNYEEKFADTGEYLQILPSETIARQARDFVGSGKIQPLDNNLCAIIIPKNKQGDLKKFTENTGQIISSRFAQDITKGNVVHDVSHYNKTLHTIKNRIASLTNAGCVTSPNVKANDVFLYLTGMASIYNAHQMIMQQGNGKKTIQFDVSYASSRRIQNEFNGTAGSIYVPYNSEDDFTQLEREIANGDISAVFCEAPNNPLLHTIDLPRLKEITRQYDVPLVIDNTIGTWPDVDVTPYADIIVTSLTKSFTGGGNVMGGALTLNPLSKYYTEYHAYLLEHHQDHLYIRDALEIEKQSRTFEQRVDKMDAQALELVDLLLSSSAVNQVNHPSVICTDAYNNIRKTNGGYGSLLSFTMQNPEDAIKIYDSLQGYKGQSLGMEFTIALMYGIFANPDKQNPTILNLNIDPIAIDPLMIRVSVGCEGLNPVQDFRQALTDLDKNLAPLSNQASEVSPSAHL